MSLLVNPENMMYAYPSLPRAGLANRLFTWARCKLFSLDKSVVMISPTWYRLGIGPLLRGEKDLRTYWNTFTSHPDEVRGFRKAQLLSLCRKYTEEDIHSIDVKSPGVIVFSGMGSYFSDFLTQRDVLRQQLVTITQPRWRSMATAFSVGEYPIGIHVRLGDFAIPKSRTELGTRGGVRTPLDWYCASLDLIRAHMGSHTGAIVVSDGSNEELQSLLNKPNVIRADLRSAIGEMLLLSRCKCIIGTGGSSFTAWSSFLGDVNTVTHPGQPLNWFGLRPVMGNTIRIECDPSEPNDQSVRHLCRALTYSSPGDWLSEGVKRTV